MFKSGVHATLAGVILAFAIPAQSGIRLDNLTDWLRGYMPELVESYDEDAHILGQHDFTHATLGAERVMHRVSPPLVRLERAISTPVNFIILPLFAVVNAQVRLVGVDMMQLALDPVALGTYFGMLLGKPIGIVGVTVLLVKCLVNAQVRLVGVDMMQLALDPVALGTYFGMLLGKPIGIVGVTVLLVKCRVAELPKNVTWRHIIGVGILGGWASWAASGSPCRSSSRVWRSPPSPSRCSPPRPRSSRAR